MELNIGSEVTVKVGAGDLELACMENDNQRAISHALQNALDIAWHGDIHPSITDYGVQAYVDSISHDIQILFSEEVGQYLALDFADGHHAPFSFTATIAELG